MKLKFECQILIGSAAQSVTPLTLAKSMRAVGR